MLRFSLMSERRTGAAVESVEALKVSVARLCSGSGVGCKRSRCTSGVECWERRGEQGGGWRLGRAPGARPALRSDLFLSSLYSPLGLADIIMYLWLLLKAAEAFKCVEPLWSQSNSCFLLVPGPALAITPPDTWCLEVFQHVFCRARDSIWASGVGCWETRRDSGRVGSSPLGWSNGMNLRPAACLCVSKAEVGCSGLFVVRYCNCCSDVL